ncbi:MAG: hypothetical protein J0H87_01960 [Holosporales bacterium]|nr:hypothetical protein [Holosporales bacterium]
MSHHRSKVKKVNNIRFHSGSSVPILRHANNFCPQAMSVSPTRTVSLQSTYHYLSPENYLIELHKNSLFRK